MRRMRVCTGLRGGVRISHQHDVLQVGALREHLRQAGQSLLRRDQHSHRAIAEDMFYLRWFENRVDGHKNTARRRGTEQCHRCFELFREEYGNAILALESEAYDAAGKLL